uniref:Uncharacterized protein n=1 Tax=Romanomermis culicivorax TaxID=13658 RepID=A0A915HU76_ROMCU
VIILTDYNLSDQFKINHWTRAAGKKFIAADIFGLVGSVFNDFGPKHVVEDANGEACVEVYVEHIDKITGDVICLEETRHNLSDGDHVTFSEVKGMTELNGCQPRKITVINPAKFNIGDLSNLSNYKEGGKAIQVKMPIEVSHKSLTASIEEPEFLISDFAKLERPSQFHILLQALHDFRQKNGRLPNSYDSSDADQVYDLAQTINDRTKAKVEKVDKKLCDLLCFGSRGSLCPMAGFIGGVTAQEVMKVISRGSHL